MGTIITNKYCKDESPLSLLLMFLSSIGVVGLLISIFFTVNPVNSIHFDSALFFIFMGWQQTNAFYWYIMVFLA